MPKIMVYPGEDFRVVKAAADSYDVEGEELLVVDGETGAVKVPGYQQALSAAGAIDPGAGHVTLTLPGSSSYAVTLAAPSAEDKGKVLVVEAAGSGGSVTLALTNVVGGSQSSTATWDAAAEALVLVAAATKWVVLKEQGVTLS